MAEGALGDYLYDFIFQREVPQEGTTNPAGNKWVRVDNPDGSKENPQSKKPKFDNPKPQEDKEAGTKNTNDRHMQSAPPKFMADAQKAYRNLDQGKSNGYSGKGKKEAVVEIEEMDSDDEGLILGDLIQPGSDALNVGPSNRITEPEKADRATEFTENDRRIWTMQGLQEHTVVINEYGSNLFNSKFDPLATIEAKNAIKASKYDDWYTETMREERMEDKDKGVDNLNQEKVQGMEMEINASSPSPKQGTQEGPWLEFSSQEEERVQETEKTASEIEEATCKQKNSLETEITEGEEDKEIEQNNPNTHVGTVMEVNNEEA